MGHNDVSMEQIRGRQVLDRAGNEVGSVEDVTFDPARMSVTGLIVRVGRDAADRLNLERPFLGTARIQVAADRLETIGDSILLNLEQREMAAMLYDDRSAR